MTTTTGTNSYYLSHPTSLPNAVCLGSGRFLRSVLVPALNAGGFRTTILQTRGTSFLEYLENRCNDEETSWNYEVDTVESDGSVQTEFVRCCGAGSMGTVEHKDAALTWLAEQRNNPIRVIGVGVTEAGLASGSKSMKDLVDLLGVCFRVDPSGAVSVINTDNVPLNGDVISSIVHELLLAGELETEFVEFVQSHVTFHNSMVDRITSQREGSNGLVPRCEPVPAKALVIEDLHGVLPKEFHELKKYGVVVRSSSGQLSVDIALKLRVANGTHTAIAHVMALNGLLMTDALSESVEENKHSGILMRYLDSIFMDQIWVAAKSCFGDDVDADAVYQDWRKRLTHPYFGLSTFFITQNGAAKGGIRISPTVKDLIKSKKEVSVSVCFSIASILRFLTPASCKHSKDIYVGWLSGTSDAISSTEKNEYSITYADGMCYNLNDGWYEFKCVCPILVEGQRMNLPEALKQFSSKGQPADVLDVVAAYLVAKNGGDLADIAKNPETKEQFEDFTSAVATLYSRMVAGDEMLSLLSEMDSQSGCYGAEGFFTSCRSIAAFNTQGECNDGVLPYRESHIPDESRLMDTPCLTTNAVRSVVMEEVAAVRIIDLHTHLLPPSHGPLCLWGIDELLTYHYLVAEYFITAPPSVNPESFYSLEKSEQANLIWDALFIKRSPISEACKGVLTTLRLLGLDKELQNRDLQLIRSFYKTYRTRGVLGSEEFCEKVFKIAGIRYAVMTNIPFSEAEAKYWRPNKKHYTGCFKSALRVDPLLAGDQKVIKVALEASGYDTSLAGLRSYLVDWVKTIKPEYMMASTPHDMIVKTVTGTLANVKNSSVNKDALRDPFAFVGLNENCADCDGEDVASIVNEESPFLDELMKLCEELDLPLAIKIGAHRQVNPSLKDAGDGMVAFADSQMLERLCSRYPRVRFLATFLSRNNQHDAAVLAGKFRNLHIYGCWWFCSNPSIIRDITSMRIEMLGTAFTAQHSDARVVDQLLYKWSHSRSVIANCLIEEYVKVMKSGWVIRRSEIRRDVQRLFGVSYEEFMTKSLKDT